MEREESAVSLSNSSSHRRVILQDIIFMRACFSFVRIKLGSFSHIFNHLFKVVETPLWSEVHTLIYEHMKELGDELHRMYNESTRSSITSKVTTCASCQK